MCSYTNKIDSISNGCNYTKNAAVLSLPPQSSPTFSSIQRHAIQMLVQHQINETTTYLNDVDGFNIKNDKTVDYSNCNVKIGNSDADYYDDIDITTASNSLPPKQQSTSPPQQKEKEKQYPVI